MSILEQKLEMLAALETVFEDFVRERYKFSCGEKCSACCTNVVAGTTLEAWRVLKSLKDAGRKELVERLKRAAAREDLFRPKITTNTLARACMTKDEPPIEEPPAPPDICPVLADDLCPVYTARPFSCRGMFSVHRCTPETGGELPPEMVTIVTICWQIIEHLDVGGLYGNLLDLVVALDDPNNTFKYANGEQLIVSGLPPTRPVPGFLAPPEQQAVIGEFLEKLFQTDVGGRTFRQRMGEVRQSPF